MGKRGVARLVRASALAMSATRVTIGLIAVWQPERLARSWLGPENGSGRLTSVRILGRASGGRDLMLGVGALAALATRSDSAGQWLAAGGIVDAVDGVATLAAWRQLPPASRGKFVFAAGATAVLSAAICAGLTGSGRSGEN